LTRPAAPTRDHLLDVIVEVDGVNVCERIDLRCAQVQVRADRGMRCPFEIAALGLRRSRSRSLAHAAPIALKAQRVEDLD